MFHAKYRTNRLVKVVRVLESMSATWGQQQQWPYGNAACNQHAARCDEAEMNAKPQNAGRIGPLGYGYGKVQFAYDSEMVEREEPWASRTFGSQPDRSLRSRGLERRPPIGLTKPTPKAVLLSGLAALG